MLSRTFKYGLMLLVLLVLVGVFALNVPNVSAANRGAWAPWVAYNVGDTVTYNGVTYQCLQAHTSQPDWTPPVTPALWKPISGTPAPTATPTRTNTPGGPTPTRTSTPRPTATPTRTTIPPTPPPPPAKMFAPYLDTGASGASSSLGNLAGNANSVSHHYTLAFILGRGCTASWDGIYTLDTAEANNWATNINNLRAAGGDVIVSFGGAAAPELADVCPDAASLQAQYQAVVSKYNLKIVDFDIEDFPPSAIDMRNQALVGLEAANPGLQVHYTLGVLESGFTSSQMAVLQNAKSHNLRVDLVNIMAMDYGHAQPDMLGAAESAAQAARSQLNSIGYTNTQLGITPMIGQNDTPGDVFSLSNASGLVSWANSNGIALLSFWSVGRDNGGCPNGSVSPSCSGIAQSQFQFSSIFRGFAQ